MSETKLRKAFTTCQNALVRAHNEQERLLMECGTLKQAVQDATVAYYESKSDLNKTRLDELQSRYRATSDELEVIEDAVVILEDRAAIARDKLNEYVESQCVQDAAAFSAYLTAYRDKHYHVVSEALSRLLAASRLLLDQEDSMAPLDLMGCINHAVRIGKMATLDELMFTGIQTLRDEYANAENSAKRVAGGEA